MAWGPGPNEKDKVSRALGVFSLCSLIQDVLDPAALSSGFSSVFLLACLLPVLRSEMQRLQ